MINHAIGFGGSPISMLELAIGLRKQGHHIITASGEDGSLRERYESQNFSVHILPRRGPMSLLLILDYIHLIRSHNIQLIHLNTFTSYFKYPAIAGKILGITVVWWSREDNSSKRCQRLMPWLRRLATHAVTVSREQTTHMNNTLPSNRIHVFYKGIHAAKSMIEQEISDFPDCSKLVRPIIGYMGALESRKGLHDLVDAMANLKKNMLLPTVLIVGNDPSSSQIYIQNIKQKIIDLSLQSQFVFLGNLTNARQLYNIADIFILPTYWDCCARVLMEAMEAKCPIITTNTGGTPEMLTNEQDAILVPPGSPVLLADAILKTITNPDAAALRANSAYKIFKNRFLFKYHINEVEKLFLLLQLMHYLFN